MMQMKGELGEKSSDNNKSNNKLEESIKYLKAKEDKLLSELAFHKNEEQNYNKIIGEYEKTISAQVASVRKLKEEHETAKRNLANLEIAYRDIHEKYERSKQIIEGFKRTGETLRQALVLSGESLLKNEDMCKTLKAHAKEQIEKSYPENKNLSAKILQYFAAK